MAPLQGSAASGWCASKTWTHPAACPAPTPSSCRNWPPAVCCPMPRPCGKASAARSTRPRWTRSLPRARPTAAPAPAPTSPAPTRPPACTSHGMANGSTPALAGPTRTACKRASKGARHVPGACACPMAMARTWPGPTAAWARNHRRSTPRSATSWSSAQMACGPTNWPSWWTTPRKASPTSCAARTWPTTRPARSGCSAAWACPRPATCTRPWCAVRTARSCPSKTGQRRWTSATRVRR